MPKPPNPELARRILSLALEELDDKSPDEVNMRALARRAGVSPTAIYYYFPSKGALFERIKFDAMAELEARVTAATAEVPAGEASRGRLAALIRAFVAWCQERPHLARLLMEELPPQEELSEEALRAYYSIFFIARDLIEAAVKEGGISPRDAELDASLGQAALWGIVTQFAAKRVHPRYWDSVEPLVDRFIAMFLGGGPAGDSSDRGKEPQ